MANQQKTYKREFKREAVQLVKSSGKAMSQVALMESLYGTLKTECVVPQSYQTRAQASLPIFEYLEAFCNRHRLHSSLG